MFKGGTSLSKCHKIINQFSEDIDLTLDQNHFTLSERKSVKHELINVCNSLEFEILNLNQTKSKLNYNCYDIKYPINFHTSEIKPIIKVETVFIQKSYPDEILPVSSIIFDYLKNHKKDKLIATYNELYPFNMHVQTIERTFVDKVFAICDYKLSNKIERNSRHIYDLYYLFQKLKINSQFKKLISDVRKERKLIRNCYSAVKDINISDILSDIISSNIYKKDYETITKAMIYKNKYLPYCKAISVLKKIIDIDLFASTNEINMTS